MINLLPPKRRVNIQLARSNTILRRYLQLGIISLVILVGAVFVTAYFFTMQKENTQQQLEIDKKKVEELSPVHDEAKELAATVNTIAALMAYNIQFSDLLVQIGGIMPPGSVLTGLQFSIEDTDSPLIVTAEVDTEEKAAILRNNLAASPLFARAEIKSITKKEAPEAVAPTTQQPAPTLLPQSPQTDSTPPATPATPTPAPVTPPSPYQFTTTINVYFKPEVLQQEKKS